MAAFIVEFRVEIEEHQSEPGWWSERDLDGWGISFLDRLARLALKDLVADALMPGALDLLNNVSAVITADGVEHGWS